MIYHGADVIPVRVDCSDAVLMDGGAGGRHDSGYKLRLLFRRKVARVVHGLGTCRPAVARHVHGEHVVSSAREKGHPTVVFIRNIERDLSWSSGAVDE